MPGARPRRDPLIRLASASHRRAPQPPGSIGTAHIPRPADRSPGSSAGIGIFGEAHYIDQWDVSDDSEDTFALTFRPSLMSWNVSLGRPLENGTDYTISGQTLTIVDPTTLFAAVASQDPPWVLQAQYDYLRGLGTDPVDAIPFVPTCDATALKVNWSLDIYSSSGTGVTFKTLIYNPNLGSITRNVAIFVDLNVTVSGVGSVHTYGINADSEVLAPGFTVVTQSTGNVFQADPTVTFDDGAVSVITGSTGSPWRGPNAVWYTDHDGTPNSWNDRATGSCSFFPGLGGPMVWTESTSDPAWP